MKRYLKLALTLLILCHVLVGVCDLWLARTPDNQVSKLVRVRTAARYQAKVQASACPDIACMARVSYR